MIVSRVLGLSKLSRTSAKNLLHINENNALNQIRKSHKLYYRQIPPFEPTKNKFAIFIGSVMWWWFFWHLFTDYKELLGLSYPDPSTWTDEELGIPQD